MKERPAARLLVLDSRNRLLLFQFVFEEGALAGEAYWATPGGGVKAGESFKDAARRELWEETGIAADVSEEIGQRSAVFLVPSGERVRADERYFFVRVESSRVKSDYQSPRERNYMKRFRWWSLDELKRTSDTVYPEELFDLLEKVSAGT